MRTSMISAALAMALVAAPAYAGDPPTDFSGKVGSYGLAGSFASVVVVTSPVWLSVGASMMAAEDMGKARQKKGEARKAEPMPPLTVEKVEARPDGAVDVTLRNPNSPDLAVVQWPARENNPGTTIKVGDVLDLTPSKAGSGWVVANKEGAALAFMPTPDAAENQMSEAY